MEIFQIIGIICGGILMLESLALYVAMMRKITPWNRIINRLYLYSDFLGGMLLALFTNEHSIAFKLSISFLLLITHSTRIVFYYKGTKEKKFLFNGGLFVINGLKMVLILCYSILVLR